MKSETFEEQIEQVKTKLYRTAYCYVKNEHDALEIVSDTIYKAYLSYDKVKQKKYFETWITRVLINTALDYLRKAKRIIFMDSVPEQAVKDNSIPLEEKYDLYDALDTLMEEDKAFIILKFFQDKSFREIAEILNMPEGTVKTRVYRILQDLRKYLEKGEEYF